MLITIVLIPVLGALIILMSKKEFASWIAMAGSVAAFLLSGLVLWGGVGQENAVQVFAGLPGFPFLLHATPFTSVTLWVVSSVALFIFIYAHGYMVSETGKKVFWSNMSLFLAAMQLLVLSGDWISFIMGWEIMGFASYRLIATWHEKKEAQEGANRAFMVTRITDMGLYIGVFMIILQTGSSEMSYSSMPVSTLAGIALLFAVMGKSAQVPFQSWLSGAMAGPTPVSSFLHSATLVAAGVILLLKAFPILPPDVLPWIGSVGGITIIMAGLTAIFSNDLKQMLAASTSSHLGFMLLAVGTGYPGAAAAHLLAHAFMKSNLFLGAGIWQHGFDGTTFKKLSAAGKNFKLTYVFFIVTALALAGVPPLVGYYSKDAVLAAGLKGNASLVYFSIATIGALITALYMGRALKLLWMDKDAEKKNIHHLNWMIIGMIPLLLIVVAGGFVLKPTITYMDLQMPHATLAVGIGIVAAIIGLAAGWFYLSNEYKNNAVAFIRNNYTIGGGYQQWITNPVFKLATYFNVIEKGLDNAVEYTGDYFYRMSQFVFNADLKLEEVIQWIGNLNLRFGRLTLLTDEKGLEEAIAGIVSYVKELGIQSRKLHTGLVHRELLWSVIGFIGFVLILILINI